MLILRISLSNHLNLISRKIWVAENLLKFHTVWKFCDYSITQKFYENCGKFRVAKWSSLWKIVISRKIWVAGNVFKCFTSSYLTLQKNKHSTVIENVKNVQGWHKGAERGFTAIYPDTIHVLTDAVKKDVPDLAIWFRKVGRQFPYKCYKYNFFHYRIISFRFWHITSANL